MDNKIKDLFEKLWKKYVETNPQVADVKKLFEDKGNTVLNDHIALRSFNYKECDIKKVGEKFVELGYEVKDCYGFEEKKLEALHMEKAGCPKVFISQIKMEEFSEEARKIIEETVLPYMADYSSEDFLLGGREWDINYKDYQTLLRESEYLAWLYVFGFVPNHFTVSVNELTTFDDISEVNEFLKDAGYNLNDSGGEIKGTKEENLRQSSIKAQKVKVDFDDKKEVELPSCYYEFAQRYNDFTGFIAKSADKIFESTDTEDKNG